MVRIACSHVIARDTHGFWRWFFDREAIAEFFTRGLAFRRYAIVSQVEAATSIERTVECEPEVALPRAIQRLFRGGFRYVETGVFDRPSSTWRFVWTPSALRERLAIEGWMRIEPAHPGACTRTAEITVNARIAGLGGLIESTGERLIGRQWDRSAVVMNELFEAQRQWSDHRTNST